MISKSENVLISKVLGRNVISFNENNTINDGTNLIAKNNIGALPVIKNKKKHYVALLLKGYYS